MNADAKSSYANFTNCRLGRILGMGYANVGQASCLSCKAFTKVMCFELTVIVGHGETGRKPVPPLIPICFRAKCLSENRV